MHNEVRHWTPIFAVDEEEDEEGMGMGMGMDEDGPVRALRGANSASSGPQQAEDA